MTRPIMRVIFSASETNAGKRSKGASVGLEYRWGWLALQAARSRDQFSVNAFVSIPFGEREFIPKIFEPAYFIDDKNPPPRPTKAEWHDNAGYGADLVNALVKQDYKNIRVQQEGNTLALTLTNSRISNLGRAVGRAARTAVAFTPAGVTTIRITYTKLDQPIATYEFFDLPKLNDYFAGKIDRQAFLDVVLLRYPEKSDVIRDRPANVAERVSRSAGGGQADCCAGIASWLPQPRAVIRQRRGSRRYARAGGGQGCQCRQERWQAGRRRGRRW